MSKVVFESGSPAAREAVSLLVGAVRDVCGAAPNYMDVTLADPDTGEEWKCTIQRPGGLRPQEKAALLESRIQQVLGILALQGCACADPEHTAGRCAIALVRDLLQKPLSAPADALGEGRGAHLEKAAAGAVDDLHAAGLPAHGEVDGVWREVPPPTKKENE